MTSRSWSSLDPALPPTIAAALKNAFGFETMTPVQASTIPVFRTGTKDVTVQACTGSGKTLAFLIPILEILLRRNWHPKEVGAVVLVPTRELAQQIFAVADDLLRHIQNLGALLLIGGSGQGTQTTSSGASTIIIGTPGRLEETFCSQKLQYDLRVLEVLVLDEADRLLDMGFEVSLRNILARLPKQRRTGLFSATQTSEVEALVRAGLRNPTRIDVLVRTSLTPVTLSNTYVTVEPEAKLAQLVELLRTSSQTKIIIFVLTCAGADYFGALLPLLLGARRRVRSLHGKLKQSARNRSLAEFAADAESTALVCTDVMARGIDIPDVDLIVQYDPPQDPSFFVHRVGRTARAGRSGCAMVFLLPSESEYVDLLRMRAVPILSKPCPTVDADRSISEMREFSLRDRDLMEKGQRAFVSFVRGYKEHHCGYIFQLKRISLPQLARGFGLLFFPRMPELKDVKDRETFVAADVDPDSIPYRQKSREKHRLAVLSETQAARKAAKAQRDRQRLEAKKRNKTAFKLRRKRKHSETQDREAEWDELDKEMKAYKKLRKGKITSKEFEIAVGERVPDLDDLR